MAKIYYTNGTGSDQTKEVAVRPEVKMYDTLTDAELDVDSIEEGQIVGTEDQIDYESIVDELVDDKMQHKGNPIGTVISYRGQLPGGYLNCNGEEFDIEKYPLLYGKLGTNKLPFLFDYPHIEYSKEYLVGVLDGRPVFRLDWVDKGQYAASNLGDGWYNMAGPEGDLEWFKKHNVERLLSGVDIRAGHSGTGYQSGVGFGSILQFDASTGYLRFYSRSQSQGTNSGNGLPRIFSITYFRSDDSLLDCEEINYKAIKYLSGLTEESDVLINDAINDTKAAMEQYNPNPIGTIMNFYDQTDKNGYLLADGSEFDVDKYPMLYGYLGSNKLPNLYNPTSLPEQPDFRGVKRTNGWIGDFPQYATVAAVIKAAGIGYDDEGFKDDGVLAFQSSNFAMLYIQNTDGTVYTAGQVSYTDGDFGIIYIDVKKGQKIYAFERVSTTGITGNPGVYYDSPYFYLTIWYYKRHSFIKAVTGIDVTDDSRITNAINTAVQAIEQYNPNPVGSYLKLDNNNYTPDGYLLCDGSEFDTEQYPLLANYLGSNKLPFKSNLDSLPSKPDIGLQTTSGYCPTGVNYTSDLGESLKNLGLTSEGDGFPYDGRMFVQVDDWQYLWMQHSDGTITGQLLTIRDSVSGYSWIPFKKGDKIYGLNRNGTSTPVPATTFNMPDYSCFYIYYAKTLEYIKAVSGVETDSTEAAEVANAVSSIEGTFDAKFNDAKAELKALLRLDETVLAEGATTSTSGTQAVVAGTELNDSLLNYDMVRFYMKRSTGNIDYMPHYEFTHEEMVEICKRNVNYSILIPGYGTEYREMTFDATGTKVTAVTGSACCWKIIGIGKRSE